MSANVETFAANLRKAVHDRETVRIGGGLFWPVELAEVADTLAAVPELLDVLLRARNAIEALDGTSVENEKLVDDYRDVLAKVGAKQ